jgi:hypothetical protein
VARQRLTRAARPDKPAPARDWGALSFLEFCEVLGIALTLPQQVLCKIAFEKREPRELEGDEFEIAQRLLKPAEQLEPVLVIPRSARRVLTLVKGGRMGGTYLSALYAAHRALAADLSTLAPGELGRVLFGAPELDLAGQALAYATGAYESHPELEPLVVGKPTASRLVIKRPIDGREVEFVTRAAARGGKTFRSRSLVCACLTEVAFFLSAEHVVNDEDCFRAVNPRVLPGGLTILESTPFAEAGLLFDQFDKNFGKPDTALALEAPTLFMLPTERNREVVEAEERRDPENALREFGAKFIAFGSLLFFPRDVLRKCTVAGEGKASAPGPGEIAAVGGDLGLTSDAAAFVAVHRMPGPRKAPTVPEAIAGLAQNPDERRDPKTDRYRVAECIERRPSRGAPLKLSELVPLAAELAARHGQKSALVDQWSVQPAREHAPKGFTLETDQADEAVAFDAALELMKAGQVEIPAAFEALLRQLPMVMSKPIPGGGKKIILPRRFGSHCDLVPAFVKAIWRAKGTPVGVSSGEPPNVRKRAMATTGGF